jgi:hypothetical protein
LIKKNKKEKNMFSSTAPPLSKNHRTFTKECTVDLKNKTLAKLDNAVKHVGS